MSKRGEKVSDDHIRHYIRTLAAKKDGNVSVEHLRKKWGIGYKRAKRLHDDELGPTEYSAKTRTHKRDTSGESVSDEHVIAYIHKCRVEGRDISTNELRHELHIGYKRAVRLLTQGEKGVRPARSPKKRSSSLALLAEQGIVDDQEEGDIAGLGEAVDELAALHHLMHPTPSKRPRTRDHGKLTDDETEDKEEDDSSVVGLEEAAKVLEGETLDEGRVETNGDGLLEFTDVVLNLPKGGGWEETLQGFEYKEK